MLCTWIDTYRTGMDRCCEQVAIGLLAENTAFQFGTRYSQLRRISVVMISCQVGENVLPATVVVDGTSRVERSVVQLVIVPVAKVISFVTHFVM